MRIGNRAASCANQNSATAGAGRLIASLRANGCREFDIVVQTLRGRDETIVFSATECVALISAKTRSEQGRLVRGGYYNQGANFARGQIDDLLQEASFVSGLRFPERATQKRNIVFDAQFRTPHVDLERLPGAWKYAMFTTSSNTVPELMVVLSLTRHRGRWRRPHSIRMFHGPITCRVPIDDGWGFDVNHFREVLQEMEHGTRH